MDFSITLYIFLGIIAVVYLKRKFASRGIQHYTAETAKEKIRSGSLLLDVRTGGERSRNSIKGSVHIPVHELSSRIPEVEKYKSREIICYCATGSRSLSAAIRLKKAGFNAANLTGGISEWNISNI